MLEILKQLLSSFLFVYKNQPSEIKPKSNYKTLTVDDIITSSGKYPERANSPECTDQVKQNVVELLKRVNPMLEALGWNDPKVSSGFRTSEANQAAGGDKASNHMLGKACDLYDPEDKWDLLVTKTILIKFDLYKEDSNYTKSWVHCQTTPTKSGNRIFIP